MLPPVLPNENSTFDAGSGPSIELHPRFFLRTNPLPSQSPRTASPGSRIPPRVWPSSSPRTPETFTEFSLEMHLEANQECLLHAEVLQTPARQPLLCVPRGRSSPIIRSKALPQMFHANQQTVNSSPVGRISANLSAKFEPLSQLMRAWCCGHACSNLFVRAAM